MSLTSHVTLGRSGLRVSPFTLGTMTFGEDLGWGSSPEESAKILAAYLDRGGNSVDTANVYTNGHSEVIIGAYLASRPDLRDRIVLGTKFFLEPPPRRSQRRRARPQGHHPAAGELAAPPADQLRRYLLAA